jgi:hypothetical protein
MKYKLSTLTTFIISISFGIIIFFLSFLTEEVFNSIIASFLAALIFDFIGGFALGRLNPKSIWFSPLLMNLVILAILYIQFTAVLRIWPGIAYLIIVGYIAAYSGVKFKKKQPPQNNQPPKKQVLFYPID